MNFQDHFELCQLYASAGRDLIAREVAVLVERLMAKGLLVVAP